MTAALIVGRGLVGADTDREHHAAGQQLVAQVDDGEGDETGGERQR